MISVEEIREILEYSSSETIVEKLQSLWEQNKIGIEFADEEAKTLLIEKLIEHAKIAYAETYNGGIDGFFKATEYALILEELTGEMPEEISELMID